MTNEKSIQILTEKQTAAVLSLGYSTLKRYRHEKRINFVRIGSRIGYTIANIQNFIERNSISSVENGL
jgi:hypothetical protein